jgi:hypothetical protein
MSVGGVICRHKPADAPCRPATFGLPGETERKAGHRCMVHDWPSKHAPDLVRAKHRPVHVTVARFNPRTPYVPPYCCFKAGKEVLRILPVCCSPPTCSEIIVKSLFHGRSDKRASFKT